MVKDHGYRFSVVTPRIFDWSEKLEMNRSEIIYRFNFLSENRVLVNYEQIPFLRMITYVLSGILKSIHVLKRDRCQLIHANFVVPAGLIGVIVAKLSGRKVLVSAHGTDITWRGSQIVKACARLVLALSDYIIVNSEFTRQKVRHLVRRKIPIEMVYAAGVNTRRFNPSIDGSIVRNELGLSDDDFVILYVGILVERKRVEDLIAAAAQLRPCHPHLKLIVAGEGELRKGLEAQVAQKGLKGTVIFPGRVPDDILPAIYALADVFVLPSSEEGLGVVLLEAMASGKPVIASRTSGILSVVDDRRTGLLFEPGNIDDLVGKIDLLMNDTRLRSELGEAARSITVQRFAQELQVEKLLGVYERCLAS